MSRHFKYILGSTILAFFMIMGAQFFNVPVQHAYAADVCSSLGKGQILGPSGNCVCPTGKTYDAAGVCTASAAVPNLQNGVATGGTTGGDNQTAGTSGCSILSTSGLLACVTYIPGVIAANIILPLVSQITALSGLILNIVVEQTVVQMAAKFSDTTSIGQAINSVWGTVRDIANMTFIFILLYTAIMTMLGKGKYKQVITNMVIAAVLINFSLFFTKVIIDAGNLLAITFYTALAPGALAANHTIYSAGLSNALMNQLHISSIFSGGSGALNGNGLITIGVMGSIVSLIAAFVFFAVAIMFVIRFVALILVLALSPLMFLGNVIPGVGGYGKQWMSTLLGQTFFAPVYFFMTWIVVKFAGALYTGPTDFGAVLAAAVDPVTHKFTTSPDAFGILLNFLMVIVFLIASLVIAKSVSGKSAKVVGTASNWLTGVTANTIGRAGRGTIGRAGQVVADSEFLKANAPTSRLARLGLLAGNKTAGASFDLRGVGAAGLGKTLGGGKAQSGGFAKDLKNKTDEEKKYADNNFKPSDLVVAQAEAELKAAQKVNATTDAEIEAKKAAVAKAQTRVDELKGADEAEMRKRKVAEIRLKTGKSEKAARKDVADDENKRYAEIARLMRDEKLSEDDAKKKAKEAKIGWAPEAVKSAINKRKEAYAQGVQDQSIGIPFTDKKIGADLTGRHLIFGPVKKERLLQALSIRKSLKEKSNKDKVAEAAAALAKDDKDSEPEETTPAPSAPSTPDREPGEGGGSTKAASE